MAQIKICGLKSEADIQMVNELRPDYCGFIINFPKSHRSKTPDEVRELVMHLDRENVTPVGVFVDEEPEVVAHLLNDGTIEIAQLHGNENDEYIEKLRKLVHEAKKTAIIKAFQIKESSDFNNALSSTADIILLDQGQGCGETFDWSMIRKDEIKRKWILAGGLNEDNIVKAIELFKPDVVDLSSAVETDKKKDYQKVKRVIERVRWQS